VRTALIVLALMGVFLGPNFFREAWAPAAVAEEVEQRPRLVAALFRSSWCSSCRIIEPRINDVRADYRDAPVEFVRFDFTLGQRNALREKAIEAGIPDTYDRFMGRTGFMVLMDRDTETIFEIVTIQYGREHIAEALDRWISVMAVEDEA
jgi:thiol-disulfide isomerase/thioredoxin